MKKKTENLIFFLFIFYSIYCSLSIGMSWDEPYLYEIGKNKLKYLLSFGKIEYQTFYSFGNISHFPGFYDTFTAFISQMFPRKLEIQIHHLINLSFSIATIIGISKISRSLFNREVSKIVFLVAALNPIFFGHMSINPKDTIIAFSNVWTTYFIIRYLQTQYTEQKRKYFSTLIGITVGVGLGIRVIFLATLLPVFILVCLDFFLVKIFSKKIPPAKLIWQDILKIFLIAYSIMVICWPEVHSNIFTLPAKLFFTSLTDVSFGTPWVLLNGEFYNTLNTPRLYLLINFFYKFPEFIIFSYIFFFFLILQDKRFFRRKFKYFNIKILYLVFIIIVPIFVAFVIELKIHDGLRYFLFLIPYLSIIPGLAIYYLLHNFKFLHSKILISLILFSFLFFLFNFISLTPYHYTYLNIFNGKFSDSSKKFENDYWGTSIKELVYKIKKDRIFTKNKNFRIAFCGVNYDIGSYYLKKITNISFNEVYKDDHYDYIIMTNRHNGKDNDKKSEVKTCFDSYKGESILSVKRNGLILSTIRKN